MYRTIKRTNEEPIALLTDDKSGFNSGVYCSVLRVIHNICVMRQDASIDIIIPVHEESNTLPQTIRRNAGVAKRDVIMNSL